MEGRLHVGLARGAIESTIHFFVSQWGDGRVGSAASDGCAGQCCVLTRAGRGPRSVPGWGRAIPERRRSRQYRRYVQRSRGKFSCAKPSYRRLDTAWIATTASAIWRAASRSSYGTPAQASSARTPAASSGFAQSKRPRTISRPSKPTTSGTVARPELWPRNISTRGRCACVHSTRPWAEAAR